MGSLAALKELFPQVDVRILRGAVLSHTEDINAAVEWIINEVLPELDFLSEGAFKGPERHLIPVHVPTTAECEKDGEALSACLSEPVGSIREGLVSGDVRAEILNPEKGSQPLSEAVFEESFNESPLSTTPAEAMLGFEGTATPEQSRAALDFPTEGRLASFSLGIATGSREQVSVEASFWPESSIIHRFEPEAGDPSCAEQDLREGSHESDGRPTENTVSGAEKVHSVLEDTYILSKGGNEDLLSVAVVDEDITRQDAFVSLESSVAEDGAEVLHAVQFLRAAGEEHEKQCDFHVSPPSCSALLKCNGTHDTDCSALEVEQQPNPGHTGLANAAMMQLKRLDGEEISGSQYWDVKDDLPINVDEATIELVEGNMAAAVCVRDRTAEFREAAEPRSMDEETVPGQGVSVVEEFELERGSSEGRPQETLADGCNSKESHASAFSSSSTSLWESLTSSGLAKVEDLDRLVEAAGSAKEEIRYNITAVEERMEATLQAEAVAVKAEVAAERGGDETMALVEELRRDMARAREALETRSGEIFGERAVLATEARELRARLVQVNAARLTARATLEDMLKDLDQRFDAAMKRQEAAEAPRKEKEEQAAALLAVEKKELANIGKQSEALDAEAEACNKLREFLVEQAGTVDALQGEVTVLFEDIEALKQKLAASSKAAERYQTSVGSSDDLSDEERTFQPLAVLASMREALGLALQPSGGLVAPTPKFRSANGSQRSTPKTGAQTPSMHDEEERAMYIARMAMIGGGGPQVGSYGSQDLDVFRARDVEDSGWHVLDMEAACQSGTGSPAGSGSRGHGSPLSSSRSSAKVEQ